MDQKTGSGHKRRVIYFDFGVDVELVCVMLEGSYYPNAKERKEMKKQLKASVVPAMVICLVLSAAVAASSAKQPETETAEDIATEPDSVTVGPAVEAYSVEFSVSHSEAQRRLNRIGGIKEALETIRGLESKRLAGWGIDHEARFGG